MNDIYPTRKTHGFNIINRIDKVSYDNEFSEYNANGFVLIKNFFCQKMIDDAKKECEDIYSLKTPAYISYEPTSKNVRSALDIHDNKFINRLLSNRLIDISKRLLSDDIYLHQSRINYKYGKDANGWGWHSDFETWHSKDGMPRMRCLTAMIPIDDNTIKNGCINFIPKSHKLFISCPKIEGLKPESEFSNQIEGVPSQEIIKKIISITKTDIQSIECKKGDLVLFDCNTLHCSGKNKTNKKRTNLYFVVNSIKNKLTSPYSGSQNRPNEMASLKTDKL